MEAALYVHGERGSHNSTIQQVVRMRAVTRQRDMAAEHGRERRS